MKSYVEVLMGSEEGYWELDMENNKALFRDWDHKREGDPKKEGLLHDWDEIYTTIEQYLKEELKMKHVKEIIPDIKYMFSKDDPFCEFYVEGMVAHDPKTKIHCTKKANVYKNGIPYCNKHGHVDF